MLLLFNTEIMRGMKYNIQQLVKFDVSVAYFNSTK